MRCPSRGLPTYATTCGCWYSAPPARRNDPIAVRHDPGGIPCANPAASGVAQGQGSRGAGVSWLADLQPALVPALELAPVFAFLAVVVPQVDGRRAQQGQQLRHQQATDDRDNQRAAHLRTDAEA